MKISKKAQAAIARYGVETCKWAAREAAAGEGSRNIAATSGGALKNSRAADVAIDAGRELAEKAIVDRHYPAALAALRKILTDNNAAGGRGYTVTGINLVLGVLAEAGDKEAIETLNQYRERAGRSS